MREAGRRRLPAPWLVFLLLPVLWFGPLASVSSQDASDDGAPEYEGQEGNRIQIPEDQTFYKWTDENGLLYFTDDLAKVPERFRDQIETLELSPSREEASAAEAPEKTDRDLPPVESPTTVKSQDKESEAQNGPSQEPYAYKEVPFHDFIRIHVGMDEAEVLSRLGFPSLITPSDYFYGERSRYRYRTIRFIYLGKRDLNQKTTVIEIRNGRVINTERIFPF